MKRRIYTDASVIGRCLDEEFEESSRELFDRFLRGEDVIVTSELTLLELEGAPPEVQDIVEEGSPTHREDVEFTGEASRLADQHLQSGAVGKASRLDAQHIAIATVHRTDVLVSWNFKHVVDLDRIRGITRRTCEKDILCLKLDHHRRCFLMTSKKQKDFDAVQLMRSLRERLGQETAGMSFKEEKEYIRNRIKNTGKQSAEADRQENAA
jgi:predicted nucleic acid-binding protein